MLWATMEQYLKQGLVSDSRVLDIRSVDVSLYKRLARFDTLLSCADRYPCFAYPVGLYRKGA